MPLLLVGLSRDTSLAKLSPVARAHIHARADAITSARVIANAKASGPERDGEKERLTESRGRARESASERTTNERTDGRTSEQESERMSEQAKERKRESTTLRE